MTPLTLTAAELDELCPEVTQPAARVRRLHAEGFVRARLSDGRVILERAHYDAVCRGEFGQGKKPAHNEPRVNLTAVTAP